MKRWWLALLLLLSIGINIGLVIGRSWKPRPTEALAPSEPRAPRQMRRFMGRMADELRLAGEPREQFIDLQQQYFRRALDSRQQIAQLRRQLRRNLMSETPDRQQAETLLQELTEQQVALERAFIDNYFDSRELLGPRQERVLRRFLTQIRKRQSELMRRAEARGRPGNRRLRRDAADGRRWRQQAAEEPSSTTEPAPEERESGDHDSRP